MKSLSTSEMIELLFYSILITGISYKLLNLIKGLFSKAGVTLPGSLGVFQLSSLYILLIIILIFLLHKFLRKRKFRECGMKSISFKDFKLAFSFFSLLFPLALLGRIIDPRFDFIYGSLNNLSAVSGLLYFTLTMPLFVFKEEIIERLLLQSRLQESYNKIVVILLLSLNFSLFHFVIFKSIGISHALIVLASVFIASILISSLFLITGNVFLTIIVHLLSNTLVAVQIFLHINGNYVLELLLWGIWAIFFVFCSKPAIISIMREFKKPRLTLDISLEDALFMVLFAIVIPIMIILL